MKYLGKILLAAGLAAALPAPALSAGFAVNAQSNSALGTAFAGAGALSEDASNQWYNPATMVALEDAQFSVAAHQLMVNTRFDADAGSNPGDMKDVSDTVPAFYLTQPVGDRTMFGLGVNAPFGSTLEYENNWGGDTYARDTTLRTLNINPSMAYDISSALQVGIGFNYQEIRADLDNAVTRMKGEDKDLGWNAGLRYEPVHGQRLGLAYRSRLNYEINGELTFHNAGALTGTYGADTRVSMPEIWIASYAGNLSESTELLLSMRLTGWGRLDTLTVDHEGPPPLPNPVQEKLKWNDSRMTSVGLRHRLDNDVVLRFGYAREKSTQSRAGKRSALSPDADNRWFSLGVGFQPVYGMTLDLGYAHVMLDDARINRNEDRDGDGTAEQLQGTYELSGNIIGAQLNYRF